MYTTNNNILNIAKYSVVTSPHSYQKPAIQDNVKGEVSRGFSTFVMKMVQQHLHLVTKNSWTSRKKSSEFLLGTTHDLLWCILRTNFFRVTVHSKLSPFVAREALIVLHVVHWGDTQQHICMSDTFRFYWYFPFKKALKQKMKTRKENHTTWHTNTK